MIIQRLRYIAKAEDINFTREGLYEVAHIADGDMRQAIIILQLVNHSYSKISLKNINKLYDRHHETVLTHMLLACQNGDITSACIDLQSLEKGGYATNDIALSILNVLRDWETNEINARLRMKYMNEISQTCMIISQGVVTYLQLAGSVCRMALMNDNLSI